jgi:hypothetical protein
VQVSIRKKSRIPDEVLSAIENNGQVTLPTFARGESGLTRRHLRFVFFFGALLFAIFRPRR